jgi:hypothetical protein
MKHGSNTDVTNWNLMFERARAKFERTILNFLSVFDPCFIRGLNPPCAAHLLASAQFKWFVEPNL